MLSDSDCKEKSQKITDLFFTQINLSTCRVLHIFLPIKYLKEVDTTAIIAQLLATVPSIKVAVPIVDDATQRLRCALLTSESEIELSNRKIPEPNKNSPDIDFKEIDIVVIPLLAADEQGHRVGYGKGFYDKFLVECKPEVLKIGLSFFNPIKKISDTEVHDIALDACITPEGIFYFAEDSSV